MPNIYKYRNKLNQIALKKQLDFPLLTCTVPIEGFIKAGEKCHIYNLYRDKATEEIYTAGEDTNENLYQLVRENPHVGDVQPFLNADEIREHFDLSPLDEKGLKIEDAQIIFRQEDKTRQVMSREQLAEVLAKNT